MAPPQLVKILKEIWPHIGRCPASTNMRPLQIENTGYANGHVPILYSLCIPLSVSLKTTIQFLRFAPLQFFIETPLYCLSHVTIVGHVTVLFCLGWWPFWLCDIDFVIIYAITSLFKHIKEKNRKIAPKLRQLLYYK